MKRKGQDLASASRTLRASEVGSYLYCRRAWWYQRQGQPAAVTVAQQSGLAWHRRHGRRVLVASGLRTVGWILIVLAAAAAAALAVEALLV
jgi:hypothetical protein